MRLARITLNFLAISIFLGTIPNALLLNSTHISLPIYFFDFVMGFIFVQSLLLPKYRNKVLDISLLLIFLWLFLLSIENTKWLFSQSSGFYLARVAIYIFSYPFFSYCYKINPILLKSFFYKLTYSIVPVFFLIFFKYPSINIPSYDPHIGRLYGIFIDPNYYAVLLTMFYTFILTRLRCKEFVRANAVMLLFVILSLFLTYSRLGILLFVAVNFYLALKTKRFEILLIMLGFVLLLLTNVKYLLRLFLVDGNFASFFYKVLSFLEGLVVYSKLNLPLGFNNIKIYRYFLNSNLNNSTSYFDFLTFNLLLTGGVFLVVLFSLVIIYFSTVKLSLHYSAFLVILISASFVMNVFFNPVFLILFILVLGVVLAGNVEKKTS